MTRSFIYSYFICSFILVNLPWHAESTSSGVSRVMQRRSMGQVLRKQGLQEANKGVRGMPRLSEATKDVVSCEKLRGLANED